MRKRDIAATGSPEGGARPEVRRIVRIPQTPALARIGKYEVESEIGAGVRIKAFTALDPQTGRAVILKLLLDVTDAGFQERFRREVALAAKVGSSRFASIYELGEHVGFDFAAMQRARTHSISGVLEEQLDLLDRVSLMWDLAEGAYAAHAAGLEYIGIRPAGIAVDADGRAVIHDFGIVRLTPGDPSESRYASPEELQGSAGDRLSDVFAFGVLSYQLLTGADPFSSGAGEQPEIRKQPAPIRALVSECPGELEDIVMRCLEPQRSLRYQSFEELCEDLRPVLRDLRRAHAAALLNDALEFVSGGRFDEAGSAVRQALEFDPDNRDADRLRNEIRLELKRRAALPRIDAIVKAAEQAAISGRYDEASRIIESAQADGLDPEVSARLDALRRRLAGMREGARLAAEARALLAKARYAEALDVASQAAAADPDSTEISALAKEIEAQARRQEQQARVDQVLAQAKTMLLTQSFDAARDCLENLRNECPGFPVVDQWIDRVESQRAAARSKAQTEAKLDEIRALLGSRQFDEALRRLELLSGELPADQIGDLVSQAREARERDAAITQTLDEAGWLIGQDRPDLAYELMREKAAESGGDPRFAARLREVEAALREWEKRRSVEDTLQQVAALEASEQWAVALTVVEEALAGNRESSQLLAAAERLRQRIRDRETRQRLNSRLTAISRRVAAQEWTQAIALIESAQNEFPGEPELDRLEQTARAALRSAERESIISDVRQGIADGEIGKAAERLRDGLERFTNDSALTALLSEVETAQRFRNEWREAQVLFGRRQFQEAEAILVRLEPEHPEVRALLDIVREKRAANEEADFYKRGVEKALKLIQEKQFDQATDLLRNLMTLFPGDPILQRHLGAAQRGKSQERVVVMPAPPPDPEPVAAAAPAFAEPAQAPEPEGPPEPEPEPAPAGLFGTAGNPPEPKRFPWLVLGISGVASLVLAGVLWTNAGKPKASPPVEKPSALAPSAALPVQSPPPAASSSKPAPSKAAPARSRRDEDEEEEDNGPVWKTRKAFNVASLNKAQRPSEPSPAPAPPPVVNVRNDAGSFPSQLSARGNVAPPPSPRAPETQVSDVRPAVLVSRTAPEAPVFATQHNIFGEVELEASVNQNGSVTAVKILKGNPLLGGAARESVMKWRYQPAMLNGKAVDSKVTVKVNFQKGK